MSDEARFHLCGNVNMQNYRYWAPNDPQGLHERPLHSEKPRGLSPLAKAQGQLEVCDHGGYYCFGLAGQVDGHISIRISFHLDVRQHLNDTLPERWIGRAGNNDSSMSFWPSRSPDLTTCDFLLWEYTKNFCMSQNLDELRRRITEAMESISEDMLT
ncbi:hypothetical protein ANN_00827 [Periplaneta americana]|uniref:Uncharacterized protein n=1 Tax=Periplaneta americana TaxID=6978 RepID=A0ABQ8TRV5_PERAM|nr:hypothetical protein ANN_00827 [Periplaneta americana]